jgi:RHS repeat-associated protein
MKARFVVRTAGVLCIWAHLAAAQLPGDERGSLASTLTGGLTQAPEASLFTGGSTTAVRLEVPPGRNGMTPQLALTYNSSGGPSLYGYGWDLPIGRIQRRLKHGVLSCANEQHRYEFVLLMPGRLVEFDLDPGSNEGFPLIQESLLRIAHVPATNSWVVRDADGRRYEFGTTPAARTGNDPNVLFAPNCSTGNTFERARYTVAWELTRIEDANGNDILINYVGEAGMSRPVAIHYGGNARQGFGHQFTVGLEWGLRPPDDRPTVSLGGAPARLAYRLTLVRASFGSQVIRSYLLTYDGDAGIPQRGGRTSFLQAVTQFAGDALNGGVALANMNHQPASTTFAYLPIAGQAFGFTVYDQRPAKPAAMQQATSARLFSNDLHHHTLRDIFDINGDGFVDWVDTVPLNGGTVTAASCGAGAGTWNVYLGSPSGFASTPTPWVVPNRAKMCVIRQERVVGGVQWTDRATLDINGDGIADYVDAAGSVWDVYYGTHTGFDPVRVPWGAAGVSLRKRETRANYWQLGYQHGTIETRGLFDVNGDGLPDLVQTTDINDPWWDVWVNTGSGFTASERFQARYGVIAFESEGIPVIRTLDINGDSLPDQVVTWDRLRFPGTTFPGTWRVHLHTGLRVQQDPEAAYWQVPLIAGRWSLQQTDASSQTVRDFFDINGDGLADIVDIDGCTTNAPHWKVALNRGAGFSTTLLEWTVDPNDCAIVRRGALQTQKEVFDVDGDGLPDVVDFRFAGVLNITRSLGGAWCGSSNGESCVRGGALVAPWFKARSDLLTAVQNGLGGTTTLEYRPIGQWNNFQVPFTMWTLTRIESDDGLCTATGCETSRAHTVERNFTYEGGLFDPVAREFRGFWVVWIDELDPARRDALLAAGTDPGVSRTTRVIFDQNAALKGKVLHRDEFANDGASLTQVQRTWSEWECRNPTTGNMQACDTLPVAVRLTRSELREGTNSNNRTSATEHRQPHRCPDGRFTGYSRHSITGDSDGAGRRVQTRTEYVCQDTGTHLFVRPIQIWKTDGSGTTKLAEEWLTYDGAGNLVRTERWLDQTTASTTVACSAAPSQRCVRTSAEYDAFGNATSVTDANGRRSQITHDTATRIYPFTVTSPPPFSQRTSSGFDPGCGTLLWQTATYTGNLDPTSDAVPKSRRRYDQFCRLVASALPDENINGTASDASGPHELYQYILGATRRPTRVITQRRERQMSQEMELYDALGRRVQSLWFSVVEGRSKKIAAGVEYDWRGNIASRTAPFVTSAGAAPVPVPATVGRTRFEYDAVNRVTRVTNPDGTYRDIDHQQPWQTTTVDECFPQPTSSCPGGKVVEVRDAFGNVVEKRHYERDTLLTRTRHTYDDLGRLLITEQGHASGWNSATQIHIDYDSLGRKIFMHDPDSGDWFYGYDAVGNLLYQEDPQPGQHVQFCYDRLNRPTRECRIRQDFAVAAGCVAPCDEEVRYTYDDPSVPNATGRLTAVTDPSGTARVEAYDVRGRVRRHRREIVVAGQSGEAVTGFDYDTGDKLTQLTYPDGEQVLYRYDKVGQLYSVRGKRSYVKKITYDLFGRPSTLLHGDASRDIWTYHDASRNFQLASLQTMRGKRPVLQYDYSYTASGLVERLDDKDVIGISSLDASATYTYDGLGRLTGASGRNLPYGPGANGYAYDPWGNLTRKEGRQLGYASTHPHTLERINGVAAGLGHDDNGNRTRKPQQSYTYDLADRLTQITVSGGPRVELLYDHAGGRVAKTVGSAVTRYYGDLLEVRDRTLIKHYFAGGRRIASQRIDDASVAGLATTRFVEVGEPPDRRGPGIALRLRPPAQAAVLLLVAMGLAVLLGIRRLREPLAGGRLPRGLALFLAILTLTGSLPLPILVKPAAAITVWPVTHYHLDHLGSTTVLTSKRGIVAQLRYKPFGELRGAYDKYGAPLLPPAGECVTPSCHEFTGYETEPISGLHYAGARLYDPDLAGFLTHDPQRQFASPYNYAGWNPVNFTDPSGTNAGPSPVGAFTVPLGNWACAGWPDTCVPVEWAPLGWGPGNSMSRPSAGRVTDRYTVAIPNPLRDCIGDRCTIQLSGVNRGGPSIARDVARAGGEFLAAQFIPGAGELLDVAVLFGSGYAPWERGLAAVSLVAGIVTAGVSPNVGPLLRTSRELKRWNPINGPGPLMQRVAETFRSGTYVESITTDATVLYRSYSEAERKLGHYWTRTRPSGPLQSVIDNAIDQGWGNRATNVASIRVPPGVRIFEGAAAPQRGLVGGGNQVYLMHVDPGWLVR